MSGQWFYEAKSKRHRDKIHGADIIRASIRKKKLQTSAEQSQNRTAGGLKTWVNNVNKDMLLSSEPMGVQEEDKGQQSDERTVVSNPAPLSDEAQENPGKSSLSTTKLRKNPFNNPMVPENTVPFQIPNEPSENGRPGLSQTSQEGALFHSKENKSTPYFPDQRLEEPRPVAQGPEDGSSEKPPIPKARKLINKNKLNQLPNDKESLPKLRDRTDFLNKRNAPRGILKRNSSSSSTDSECFRSHHTLESRNKNLPAQLVIQEGNSEKDDFLKDESSQNPLEPLKQVRFSAVKEVSQGPELNHGRELGEFGLLESDIPMSGMEDASDLQEPANKPLFSRYRQPAQEMSPASDTCQINEISLSQENLYDQKTHPQSEILTERQPFSETSSTERMSKEALSKGLSLESELCKNPADECTHWVEPEPPQVHGIINAADHQQGKHLDFKALNAKTNFQYDQKDTRQRNATNSSISKVLYWFSRSSNPDPEEPSFLHHEGKLSKGKIDSACQDNNTMDTENAIFQQAPISMKGDIKPGKTGPFWMKGDPLCFENKNSSIEIKKLDGAVLPKQAGKEKEQQSLSFKSHNQGSKSTIPIQDTKNPNKEIDIDFLNTDSMFFKELDAKSNMSSKGEDSSHKEKLKVFVKGKSKGNSEIDFSESNGECKFKHIMEAKSRRVKKADCLSFSSEGENISSFFNDDGFRENESNFSNYKELSIPCKEPDDLQQQKPSHLSGTQEKREIYKNVSDRISFWEGGRKTAKINAKMLHSAGEQLQVPARINLPMKSIDLSMKNLPEDQNEYGQVIAKKVDLNKNGQTSHAPVIYSSVNHEGFKSQTMNTSREYPSVDHPGKIPSFQNEYSKLPMTDNLQSKRDEKTFSISKPDSHERNETCSHLQNGRSSIAQPNPTFKFWTLKEKMNENFPKQINSPSQFQNLRNFWDVVTNSGSTNNNTHPSSENPLSSDSQRDELDETELTREKSASVGQDLPRQNKTSVGEEITESDSKLIPHSLSDETTFLLISPAKSIQLPRNVPSKENVDEYLDWWVPQKLKEEGYFSMEEVKESVIKTNILPKEYQDNFNRSLKKLLEGAPSLSPQLVGDTDGLGNGQFSENRRYLQEADLTDLEERSESLQQDSKISTAIILDPPEVQCKPFIPSPEKPLKKAPELPDSSSQIRSECVSTTTSSLSKQRRFFEKVMERSYNKSFYENEGGILLEEVRDASNNTVVPSKIKTSGHEISQKALLQEAPASSHSLCQTANLKESFGEETKSFQEMSSYNPPLQDQIKPSQKEISETVEKTVVPKIEFSDYHSTLEKFFREIQEETFNCTRKEKKVSRKREPEFAEGVAVPTHNQINSAVKMTGESVVPDEKSFQPIDMGLEEPKEEELDTFSIHCHDSSYVDQSLTQPGSISNQHSKVLPQEISEIITENIIQSGASLREFNIGIDKLLMEASESSPLKMEVEEIQETIEKSSAPSVVESAFDLGLEKILKEASVTLPTITEEKEALSNKASPPEQEKLSRKMPHLYSRDQEDAKVKIKRKVLKPEGQDPSESVPRKKTCSKISKVSTPYTKTEEKESSSGSDFSDGFVSSNSDSRRSSSCSEESNPVERNADRKMPSQNLEDIPSETSNQSKVDFLPEDLVRSAEDDQKKDQEQSTNDCISGISTVPSHPDNQFAYPEKIKRMSKSVPTILQDENDDRETDASSESGYPFGRNKKSMSSFTLSSSSGMTSLSSVSGSAVSIYSGDFGDLDIKGSIQFAIDYVDSLMELHVFVAQCKDLAAADVKKQRSDPYVKTYLLPAKGKMGKKKTLVMKKTLNPVYNEILRYKIDKQSLKTQKLHLSVWHRDMFKHNRFLGEVELDLETWDWDNQQNKQLKWYLLNRRMTPIITEAEKRGEMRLALQYVPEPLSGKKLTKTGEVHIWVKECIDLPCLQGNHLNSFVKCIFLPDTSRKSRQKTKTIAKTTNPFFNHAIVYDGFTPEDLKEACAELTVWDHHRLRNQFLGGLRLGFGTGNSYGIEVDWMDSTPAEVSLWERMVNSPNTWVEDILPLRMLLIAKLTK